MMMIPPLKALCVGKITTEIWKNRVTVDIFVTYVTNSSSRVSYTAEELNTIQKDYCEEIENIFKQIMDLSMPKKIKLRLCAAMSNLERDAFTCCEDAGHLFEKNKKEDHLYLMSKLHFTPTGLVDRSKTIVRSIIDSFGKLNINYRRLSRFCCFNKEQITEYVNNYRHTYNINASKILKKVLDHNVSLYSYEPDNLVEEAVNNLNLVFEYMYDKCTDTAKPSWLCRMLIHIFNSSTTWTGWIKRLKIIFIYERLNEEIWQKIIIQYGKYLVTFFLMTEQIDYCLCFYKQVCLYAPQYCDIILEYAMDNIYSCDDYPHCTEIFEKLNEETFFSIWFQTPPEIKNSFISNNDSIYRIFCFKDYELISTILNDPALTTDNKNHLVDFLIVSFKCYLNKTENEVLLKRLIKEFRNDSDFVDMPTVKLILEKRCFYMYSHIETGTILSDKELIELKTLVSQDENFVINVVKNYINVGYLLNVTEDALKFKFGDNKTELLKYVSEKFVYEQEFICVYHLIVEEMKDFDLYNDTSHQFLIDIFRDATVRAAIKKVLNETNLFEDYLQRIIGPETDRFLIIHKWNPYRDEHKPYFFEEFLTTDEIQQKIRSYLISETGLKDIINAYFITTHHDIQTVNKEHLIMVQRSVTLFREYWLKPYKLHRNESLRVEFVNYLSRHYNEVYQKYFRPPKDEQLLPNQCRDDYETIVKAFFKLFVCELLAPSFTRSIVEDDDRSAYSLINMLAKLRRAPSVVDV